MSLEVNLIIVNIFFLSVSFLPVFFSFFFKQYCLVFITSAWAKQSQVLGHASSVCLGFQHIKKALSPMRYLLVIPTNLLCKQATIADQIVYVCPSVTCRVPSIEQ